MRGLPASREHGAVVMPARSSESGRPLMLFDLDGTLVDHDTAELAAINGWMQDAGFPSHVEDVPTQLVWRRISEEAFPDFFAGRTTLQEQRRLRVRRFLPLMGVDSSAMSDGQLDAQFDEYRWRYQQAWRAFPDVADCLTRLADTHRIAVLTNGDHRQQSDKVRRAGLDRWVEDTIATSTLGVAKPDRAAFDRALRRLEAIPASSSYVGDRLDIDAQAATAAGLTGIWLNRTGDSSDPGLIRTVTTLADLP
jgi:putative hydrolase of the HAD superfamily